MAFAEGAAGKNMSKLDELIRWIEDEERVVVAFSGGIDSAVLAFAAHCALGKNMIAVTGDSDSLPSRDRKFAIDFSAAHSIPHLFIETVEFSDERYRLNPKERCYYCKLALFSKLSDYARRAGYKSILDGTNASDLMDYRPGYKVITELEIVKAPFVELEITKKEIREIAAEMGLSIKDKPSSACLASRIPWGIRIEPSDLKTVDAAENALRDMGFTQVRVRHHGEIARIQLIEKEFALVLQYKTRINKELKKLGYRYVTVDMNCYIDK